jgi:hypothetical protein
MAPQIEEQKRRVATGLRLGPPWKITLPGGTEITAGQNDDEPDAD